PATILNRFRLCRSDHRCNAEKPEPRRTFTRALTVGGAYIPGGFIHSPPVILQCHRCESRSSWVRERGLRPVEVRRCAVRRTGARSRFSGVSSLCSAST